MPDPDYERLVRVIQRIRSGWLPHAVGSSWWYGRPACADGFRLWSAGQVPSMIVVDRMDADEAKAWEDALHPLAVWNGEPLRGLCGHCGIHVDSTDPNHRVTSIVRGGRGVECILRGDILPVDGGPLTARSGEA